MIDARIARLMGGEAALDELGATLREVGGTKCRIVRAAKLNRGVYRLLLATPHQQLSVVAKRLEPPVAHRSHLLLKRWLPAAGLAYAAPALIAVAAERAGRTVWHLYEDLGTRTLEHAADDPDALAAAVRLIATLHAKFIRNPVLAESRLWGRDHGMSFYDSSVNDAIASISAVNGSYNDSPQGSARARLLEKLERLLHERDERARALGELGGPETLLHGDLWPKNVVVAPRAERQSPRLIGTSTVARPRPRCS